MDGEADAHLFEFGSHRARVRLAGLDPVRDKDDSGGPLGEFQRLGGLAHRLRHRRLALGADLLDPGDEVIGRQGPRLDQRLDVVAGALLAVAIDHEAQLILGLPGGDNLAHHVFGDIHLGLAVDLGPHRARAVEDKNDALALLRRTGGRDREGWDDEERGGQQTHDMTMAHVQFQDSEPPPEAGDCRPMRQPSTADLIRGNSVQSQPHSPAFLNRSVKASGSLRAGPAQGSTRWPDEPRTGARSRQSPTERHSGGRAPDGPLEHRDDFSCLRLQEVESRLLQKLGAHRDFDIDAAIGQHVARLQRARGRVAFPGIEGPLAHHAHEHAPSLEKAAGTPKQLRTLPSGRPQSRQAMKLA